MPLLPQMSSRPPYCPGVPRNGVRPQEVARTGQAGVYKGRRGGREVSRRETVGERAEEENEGEEGKRREQEEGKEESKMGERGERDKEDSTMEAKRRKRERERWKAVGEESVRNRQGESKAEGER